MKLLRFYLLVPVFAASMVTLLIGPANANANVRGSTNNKEDDVTNHHHTETHPRHQQARFLNKKGKKGKKHTKKGGMVSPSSSSTSNDDKESEASSTSEEDTTDDEDNPTVILIPERCQLDNDNEDPQVLSNSTTTTPPTDTECLFALLSLDFDLFDFDRYPEYFDDNSILQLAETGDYRGITGITEYIAFTSAFYFDSYEAETGPNPLYGRWNQENQVCEVVLAPTNRLKFNTALTGLTNTSTEVVVGLKVEFILDDTFESGGYVTKLKVFYPNMFLDYLFAEVFATPQIARKVCEVMESNCTETFYNIDGFSTIDDCIEGYYTLDQIEPGFPGYVDGRTRGCRELHVAFAAVNQDHCPHLSLTPQYDVNCELKCQVSKQTPLLDLWTQEELDYFASVAESRGYTDGYQVFED